METKSRTMTPEEEAQLDQMVVERDRDLIRERATRGYYPPPKVSGSSGLSGPEVSTVYEGKVWKHSSRLKVGFADTIGRRQTMEDRLTIFGNFRDRNDEDFIAVYDGHGGQDVSDLAAQNLHEILKEKMDLVSDPRQNLREAFLTTDQMIRDKHLSGGSTALVAYFVKNKCFISNAGDSRAVLCVDDRAIRCSTDHKPDVPSEEARIKASGGTVLRDSNRLGKVIPRVDGLLSVARALGDTMMQPHVTPEPETVELDVGPLQNQLLILACDGLWDVLTDDEAVSIARSEQDPQKAAERLRDIALQKGSMDNISVIVIELHPQLESIDDGNRTWTEFFPVKFLSGFFIMVGALMCRNWFSNLSQRP